MAKQPDKELYEHKVECLRELEALNSKALIDLYYGDETGVSTEGYCPYGWQGKEEKVSVASLPITRQRLNCFGWTSRRNNFHYAITTSSIDGAFIFEHLEAFSWKVQKPTFIVLDNARVHKTANIQKRLEVWQQRGLYLFYLPPYSPHLNIAETLWRILKGKWLEVTDYLSADHLFYATKKCLAAVGKELTINYAPFNIN